MDCPTFLTSQPAKRDVFEYGHVRSSLVLDHIILGDAEDLFHRGIPGKDLPHTIVAQSPHPFPDSDLLYDVRTGALHN